MYRWNVQERSACKEESASWMWRVEQWNRPIFKWLGHYINRAVGCESDMSR